MKYVITGGAGNISKPLIEILLAAGHAVTVIGRHAEKLQSVVAKGATAAIGSVEDEAFVTNTFAQADAVYLMIPPNFEALDWKTYQNKVADIYVKALQASHIKYAVVLSSIGAHMGNGAGPVDGVAYLENKLLTLTNIAVKNLRPSYFMTNLLAMIPMIKGMNIMGSNFGNTDEKLVLVHPNDIATAAAEELLGLAFTGQSVRYIASDEKHPNEIAEILSSAIGQPGLPWVCFTDEQANTGMLQNGFLQTIADGYTTLGKALRDGDMQFDYWKNRPTLSKTTLQDFAVEFANAFKN